MKENYTDFVKRTSTYPNSGHNVLYPLLGLISEVGEVVEKLWESALYTEIKYDGTAREMAALLASMITLGETASYLKKQQRDHNENVSSTTIDSDANLLYIIKELGDCQWYLEALSQELRSTGERDREINVEKLTGRLEHGTVKGNGDDR